MLGCLKCLDIYTWRYIFARLANLAFVEVEYVVIHSITASDESSVNIENKT